MQGCARCYLPCDACLITHVLYVCQLHLVLHFLHLHLLVEQALLQFLHQVLAGHLQRQLGILDTHVLGHLTERQLTLAADALPLLAEHLTDLLTKRVERFGERLHLADAVGYLLTDLFGQAGSLLQHLVLLLHNQFLAGVAGLQVFQLLGTPLHAVLDASNLWVVGNGVGKTVGLTEVLPLPANLAQ